MYLAKIVTKKTVCRHTGSGMSGQPPSTTVDAKKAKPKRIITDPITNLRAHVEFLSRTSPHDPLRDGFDLEFKVRCTGFV